MICSYSSLEDAWDTPRDRYRSSRKDHRRRDVSPSLTPSSSSEGAQTLVIGSDEGYESSVPGDRDVIIARPGSRSPSVSQSMSVMDSRSFVTSGRGSPVSFLDEDDYASDSGESVMMSRSASASPSPSASIPRDLPGFPSGSNPPQSRPLRTPGLPGAPGSPRMLQPEGTTDKKMMRQILRIRDDVREMLQSQGSYSGNNANILQSFPFMETGLFIAIGLFVLLAMQMMVQLRPVVSGVVDAGTSIGTTATDMIKNIRLVE